MKGKYENNIKELMNKNNVSVEELSEVINVSAPLLWGHILQEKRL
jgi:hypothetical protein